MNASIEAAELVVLMAGALLCMIIIVEIFSRRGAGRKR